MLNMSFHIHAYTQHHQTDPQSSERGNRKPSPLLTKRETQGECSQSDSQHCRSKWIETLMSLPLRALLTIKVRRGKEGEQADWHIDIKDPTPGQILRNDPSNGRPGSHAQRYHHRIQAQCQSSLSAGKCRGNHCNVDRKDERAPDTLEKASENEQQQRRGQA